MKALSIVLAVLAMLAGLLAARYWHKASKPVDVGDAARSSGDPEFARALESYAIQGSLAEAARWNALGARWAALAALLGGASTLTGSLA